MAKKEGNNSQEKMVDSHEMKEVDRQNMEDDSSLEEEPDS